MEKTYRMWSRFEDDELPMSQSALKKILSETEGILTGPFGGMGEQIDLVLYEDAEDGIPSVAAVHIAPEIGGHWYTIPDSQSAFISHELSKSYYHSRPDEL